MNPAPLGFDLFENFVMLKNIVMTLAWQHPNGFKPVVRPRVLTVTQP
jgi:hypothetical protein